jgi:DNA-binding CsgD family transcriptional regulator
MAEVNDFFPDINKITHVAEEAYQTVIPAITALEAIARTMTMYHSIYVIDYYRKNFLYVSENSFFLYGDTPETVRDRGYDFYLQHVSEDEISMILEINRAGFEFYAGLPAEERTKYTISYDFHIIHDRRKMLVNNQLTPLMLSNGAIWLSLCVASFSSYKNAGHIEVHKVGEADYWVYSLEDHKWVQADRITLSNREKNILLLSARGYTMDEIADQLHISPDTVKFHKRKLFEKLNVNNVIEALSVVSNYKMM